MPLDLDVEPLTVWIEPAIAFATLEPAHPDLFWLDAGADATSGWSFVGIGDAAADGSGVRAVRLDTGGAGDRTDAADGAGTTDFADPAWPAGPFRGGWVGWWAYPGTDEDAWMRVRSWVAFDHASRRAWAVAPRGELRGWVARLASSSSLSSGSAVARPAETSAPEASVPATSRHTPEHYAALIARCRDAIRAGDAYQLCLTTRFEVETFASPASVYARLRASSPTHHGGFVRIGGASLLSASPEEFLGVRDGVVRTRPIKGTRPRGSDPGSDAALARELQASAKERAENVMIVDLMRNDLSRVCEVGSVRVDALLAIESYPHVHQLVSTVSGRLRPGATVGDLIDRAFPAGSMTGAPKLSAMSILRELEGGPRGIYAGCFGWIGADGSLDLAMIIRSIAMVDGCAIVGAGGGITWSSIAEEEVREVGIKARAPLAALGAGLPPGW